MTTTRYAILFVVALFLSVSSLAQSAGIDTVLARYKRLLVQTPVSPETVSKWMGTINEQGQWPDVDYKDTVKANWKTSYHLRHLRDLAISFNQPSKYSKADLGKAINAALDHWLQQRYKNSNWWHNQIGVPQLMRDIIILFRDSLTPERFKQALEVLGQYRISGTGANLTWSTDLAFHYGALTNDTALMRRCVDLMTKEIKVSADEGVQPDYSFHQHGKRLQIYSYGEAFLKDNVRLAWQVLGTPWAFPAEKTSILIDFVINGWQWMSRGINTVPGTVDRAVSRPGSLHNADIRGILPMLKELDPAKTSVFAAIDNRQNGKGPWLQGFRYFPYSDFTAYHTPQFSFFLKTISTRTLHAESINSENLKGRLMNSGDAYIIQNGKEYYDIMPSWHWDDLPGITSVSGADAIIRKSFVGGITDKRSGATVMDYALADSSGKQIVAAKKFWACHDELVVCLIAGLQCRDDTYTVLDQSRLQSPVIKDKPGHRVEEGVVGMDSTKWLYHHQTAYIFLQPAVSAWYAGKRRIGTWNSINASQSTVPVIDSIFLPEWKHDKDQHSGGYVIAHCKPPKKIKKLIKKPGWKIIVNTDTCQAVQFNDGTTMIAFWKAGSVEITPNKKLSVDNPCLIQLTDKAIYASDPNHAGIGITVTFEGMNYAMALPDDGTTMQVARYLKNSLKLKRKNM